MKQELNTDTKNLNVIPLGGLEVIGMNITALCCGDSIIVVDCGSSFPTDDMYGIDLVIPDITFLKENADKVRGFVFTHGHEDHIGALPYILKELNVPVYATRLTIGLIEGKLKEHGLENQVRLKTVKFSQVITLGNFHIEFIKTNHSIVDAAALAIYCPAGTVIFTGDFKIDYTPVFGDAIDLQRFGELGKKGVLALMCDSTNAERSGFTLSEKTVGKTFDTIFAEHPNSRIIVATFASNVDRVQQIINSAYKAGRKVAVDGRSMVNTIDIALRLECLEMPPDTLVDLDDLDRFLPHDTVLITTGSQGESMAALSRMAANVHRKIKLGAGDLVILSSNPIPGNEKAISNVINGLFLNGADVIFQDTHVSGHACAEEIKLIYALTQPKYAVPVHGEYKHLKAQEKLALELGYDKKDIFVLRSGDILNLSQETAGIDGKVPCGQVFVDGLGVGDVGNAVLRDRQHMGDDGIVIVSITVGNYDNTIMCGPEILTKGFIYVKESEDIIAEIRECALETAETVLAKQSADSPKMQTALKNAVGDLLWKRTKRRPMILPIIMEV